MGYKLLRFHFKTPVHLGSHRADYDRSADMLHSDTLYASIIQAWSTLGVEHPLFELAAKDEERIAALDLGFVLSSMFPFYWDKKKKLPTYFFPIPTGLLNDPDPIRHKKLKSVKFADMESYLALLSNEKVEDVTKAAKGKFLTKHEDFEQKKTQEFYNKKTVSRNYVPQEGDGQEEADTEIFYMERITFHQHSGLFCLVKIEEESREKDLMAAIRYLQDEGIGSDRNVGNGQFELEVEELPVELQSLIFGKVDTNYRLNLSLFCPENVESLERMLPEGDTSVQYQLKKRGGWIGSYPYLSLRKNAVYMFEEGSIFRFNEQVAGKTVNLKPDRLNIAHNIYRVGRSLFLPINLNKSHES